MLISCLSYYEMNCYKHMITDNFLICWFDFFWINFLGGGWSYIVYFFSDIWGISILSSIMVALVYISSNSGLADLSSHSLNSIYCFLIAVWLPFSLGWCETLLWFLFACLCWLMNLSIFLCDCWQFEFYPLKMACSCPFPIS